MLYCVVVEVVEAEYNYRLLKNGTHFADLKCPYNDTESVRDLVGKHFFDDKADLVVLIEKEGKFEHFFTIFRDTTLDGLVLCPKCSSEMSVDKFGQYCPECDYRE